MVDSSIAINEVDAEAWLRKLTGTTPQTSVGWFRAGVGFYRKKYHNPAVTCLEKAVNMDPINYEAWQVLARAYILQNRRKDAIEALKKSVKLNNAADWQMLVELTNLEDEQNSSKNNTNTSKEQNNPPKKKKKCFPLIFIADIL
jgi:predicted Zn-dependent protease